jgi:hypothetical protein
VLILPVDAPDRLLKRSSDKHLISQAIFTPKKRCASNVLIFVLLRRPLSLWPVSAT